MLAVDLKDKLPELQDDKRKIPSAHLSQVCQIGNGEHCCKYVFLTPAAGFVCAKHSLLKVSLDNFAREKRMKAQGDNCEGLGV